MTDRLSSVHDLRSPRDLLALRLEAAEQLMRATEPAEASRELFELIATELKLNVFLFHALDDDSALKLLAHGGLSEAEAATVVVHGPPRFSGGRAGPVTVAAVQARGDDGTAVLRSIGLKAYYSVPLLAGKELIGFLGFGRRWADGFDDEDCAFLRDVGRYFALALKRGRWEARLGDSEERLRLGMEVAGFGTYDYNLTTGQLRMSPEALAIRGLPSDRQVTLTDLGSGLHPDDRNRARAAWQASVDPNGPGLLEFEYRVIWSDGSVRWVHARRRTFFAGEGSARRAIRVIGLIQDITEAKRAEQRLRESEERLQLAQELGGVASFEVDTANDELWVSESYRRIFGVRSVTAPLANGIPASVIHPGDLEQVHAFAKRILETGKREPMEFRIIRPSDGQERWIWSVCGVSRNPSSGSKRLVGIALDVTERKRDQERERLLSREVDHRAKNLLSVVQAVVQLTQANSIPEFVSLIKGRIHALGRVHSLLAASRWDGAELSKLIEDELAPFVAGSDSSRLTGPYVALKPAAAQSMTLVIHELTTNAVKHGALSVQGGRVDIMWDAGSAVGDKLVLHWRESGGPAVVAPRHLGFGMTHIRGSIEHQLGGAIDINWHGEGMQCELVLPPNQILQGSIRQRHAGVGAVGRNA